MEKRKPFFTGYRPQFYFRTEENKKEVSERLLPKAIISTEYTQQSGSRKGSGGSYE
ncbi:hypothetical protein [Paenibacillus sp. FSL L8-0494]|uniref:hypothetical protein n=1 Tax=Paenibacillus sp. FSL L8-0494 TaxID=2975352 RepID=UPI0030F58A7F